jgi:hypothetical protein
LSLSCLCLFKKYKAKPKINKHTFGCMTELMEPAKKGTPGVLHVGLGLGLGLGLRSELGIGLELG